MSKDIREMIEKVKNFKQFINENTQYNSFSKLTEKDLYDIAKWGL